MTTMLYEVMVGRRHTAMDDSAVSVSACITGVRRPERSQRRKGATSRNNCHMTGPIVVMVPVTSSGKMLEQCWQLRISRSLVRQYVESKS